MLALAVVELLHQASVVPVLDSVITTIVNLHLYRPHRMLWLLPPPPPLDIIVLLSQPGSDIMTKFDSSLEISCRRDHFRSMCHVCQLGRPACLSFATSISKVERIFDLVRCDF